MPVAFELGGYAGAVAIGLVLTAMATLIVLAVRARRMRQSMPSHTAAGEAEAPEKEAAGTRGSPKPGSADTRKLASLVERAESVGEKQHLPQLYLALGRAQFASGQVADAAGNLRRSIRLASELQQHETHGLARLELGDLALAEGDLTSACEHWQIARTLFQDLQRPGLCAQAEARMRKTQCPTDWVLNEF